MSQTHCFPVFPQVRRCFWLALPACALWFLIVVPGAAAELRVLAPSADCREQPERQRYCDLARAIVASNRNPGEDVIQLAPDAIYTLSRIDHEAEGGNALPAVVDTLTMLGNGATLQRGDAPGTPLFRLLRVAKGGALSLKQLRMRNGATGRGFDGAAIWSTGTLALSECTLEDNQSGDDGGAIRSDGVLRIHDSVLRKNSARGRGGVGGAIQTHSQFGAADTVIARTALENNEAWAGGGALWLLGSTALDRVTLTGNRAGDRGGAVMNYGDLKLDQVNITGNQAVVTGGGLFTYGPARLIDSMVIGNHAMIASDCEGAVLASASSQIGNTYRCDRQLPPLEEAAASARSRPAPASAR